MAGDCLFCKIAAGEIPSKILYQTEEVLAFADINPVAPTHILIIPRRHIQSVASMEEADAGVMGKIVLAAHQIAREQNLENGFRLVANAGADAGQVVPHLHFHLLGGRSMSWPPG